MPNPQVLFVVTLATLVGTAFHLIFGGNLQRLILYIVSSWLGFLSGNIIANSSQNTLALLGDLHVLHALGGAIVFVLVTHVVFVRQ